MGRDIDDMIYGEDYKAHSTKWVLASRQTILLSYILTWVSGLNQRSAKAPSRKASLVRN